MRMKGRLRRTFCALSFAFALASVGACAAPTPSAIVQAEGETPATASDATQAPAVETTPQPAPKKPMRTGGPLPPERVDESRSAQASVDTTCRTDADCTVKNVGNCCGYYPACVNVSSPTDPEAVQAECAKKGLVSVCGFPDISSCTCSHGRCEAGSSSVVQ